jgi:hypothetical protein
MSDTKREKGVLRYFRDLPRRHSQLFAYSSTMAIFTTGLDAVSLALVAPVIALIAGSQEDLAGSEVVEWTRTVFGWVGLELRLRWLVLVVLLITLMRSGMLLLQSWITAGTESSWLPGGNGFELAVFPPPACREPDEYGS